MGTLYFGPYHEEIDTYTHEGYTARVMPDGTEPGGWGYGYPADDAHVGYRARCGCGWASPTVHPKPVPDEMECPAADADWNGHIAELVDRARRQVWPDWQRLTRERADRVVELMAADGHRRALDLLVALRDDAEARIRTVEDLAEEG